MLGLLLTLAIPQTLEFSIAGSDLIFMGFGLLARALLLERSLENPKYLWSATLVLALVTSSRVSTPILGLVFAMWLWLNHKEKFIRFFTLFFEVAALPTILFFVWNPSDFSSSFTFKGS